MMEQRRRLVIFVTLLTIAGMTNPRWAETEGAVESRGLNLPRVTVPAPPPPPAKYLLTVRTAGDGTGKVPLTPSATCPPTCSTQYLQGTPIVRAPVPEPGSTFAGWGGDCRGTGPCILRMDRPHSVEARFIKLQSSSTSAQAPVSTTKTPSAPAPVPIPYPNVGGATPAPELAAISTMLADGKPANTILDAWNGYVTRRVQAKQPTDVTGIVNLVKGQAESQVNARTDAVRKTLGGKMNSLGDDAQLANVELQNALQKQQQALQAISNISKLMQDSAMAIIRKIGG